MWNKTPKLTKQVVMRTKMFSRLGFSFHFLLCFHLLLIKLNATDDYTREDFPPAPKFVFGSSTAAYQVEGAASEDGRTPSIWDITAHAGYDFTGSGNGDIACDTYHKYKEDVQLMVDTGLEAYRFSISWSRLIPNGSGSVNPKGLEYYNNLINELITHGIQPHVTLVHSDLPQILEDRYGGWRSRKLVEDYVRHADVCFRKFGNRVRHWTTLNEANIFVIGGYDQGITPPCRCQDNCTIGNSITEPYMVAHNLLLARASAATLYRTNWIIIFILADFVGYADVCFREFGDRVLHWTTLNEANIYVLGGYDQGVTPPCRCSSPFGLRENCTNGNSISEPFIVAHNMLLAHALAVNLYRRKYQATQLGFIGINLFAMWYSPSTNSSEDAIATQRAIDYQIGWFMHPLVFGDYPEIMKKNSGSKLPIFAEAESMLVKDSFDFLGLNHYTTIYVVDKPNNMPLDSRDINADMAAELSGEKNHEIPIWQIRDISLGLQGILEYLKNIYGNPPIFIHENGQMMHHNSGLDDMSRLIYVQAFIKSLLHAIRNGSNAKGYFVWSFLDSYEIFDGFDESYGLYFVDFEDEKLRRYPKLSAKWYSKFLKRIKKYQSY